MNSTLLEDLLHGIVAGAPRFIMAMLVLIVGWLIASTIKKILFKALKSTSIDKLGEKVNDIDFMQKSNIQIDISKILAKTIYYLMLLFFMIVATDILQMEAVSQLVRDLLNYIPNVIAAGIVLIVGILIADGIKNMVFTTCKSLGIPSANLIASFVFYFIFLTVAISAMSQAKIDTTFIKSNLTILLAGIVGAFAFGYGYASRDMMSNFLASFYSKEKLQIGDIITVEGVKGEVVEIDSASLTLKSEGKKILIPLRKLSSEKVEIEDHDPDEDE